MPTSVCFHGHGKASEPHGVPSKSTSSAMFTTFLEMQSYKQEICHQGTAQNTTGDMQKVNACVQLRVPFFYI